MEAQVEKIDRTAATFPEPRVRLPLPSVALNRLNGKIQVSIPRPKKLDDRRTHRQAQHERETTILLVLKPYCTFRKTFSNIIFQMFYIIEAVLEYI